MLGFVSDRKPTSGYCIFVGGNLVTWRSKKHTMVAISSAKAEYRAVSHAVCELRWVQSLLQELKIFNGESMTLYYDNQAASHVANNPVSRERTKHIEVDCHYIREKVVSKEVVTKHVLLEERLADIFIKALGHLKV